MADERTDVIARLEGWRDYVGNDGDHLPMRLLDAVDDAIRLLRAPAEETGQAQEGVPHGSCLICGHDKPYQVWHVSGSSGVCRDCYDKAKAHDAVVAECKALSGALDASIDDYNEAKRASTSPAAPTTLASAVCAVCGQACVHCVGKPELRGRPSGMADQGGSTPPASTSMREQAVIETHRNAPIDSRPPAAEPPIEICMDCGDAKPCHCPPAAEGARPDDAPKDWDEFAVGAFTEGWAARASGDFSRLYDAWAWSHVRGELEANGRDVQDFDSRFAADDRRPAPAAEGARPDCPHSYAEFVVCRLCGQTEAAIEGCHHCNELQPHGRCRWCLKPQAAPTPSARLDEIALGREDDGDLTIDIQTAADLCVSLTFSQDGHMGFSFLNGAESGYGRVAVPEGLFRALDAARGQA